MAVITTLNTEAVGYSTPGSAASVLTFARSASLTPYASGQVISDSTTTAKCLQFGRVGVRGMIWHASMISNINSTMALYLFDREPTNFADQTAMVLADSDRPKLIGSFLYTTTNNGVFGSGGTVLHRAQGNIGESVSQPLMYSTTDGNIHGLLLCLGAPTPTANSLITIRLHLQRDF